MSIYKQRLGFLGDSGIGKSVLFAYLTGKGKLPTSKTLATDYADFQVPHSIGGGATKYLVWDVPGSALEECRVLGCCVRMAMLFICFSPHNRTTWLHVPRWVQEATERSPYCIVVIISIYTNQDENVEVSQQEIDQFVNKHKYLYKSVNLRDKMDCLTQMGELLTHYHKTKHIGAGELMWDEYMKQTIPRKQSSIKADFTCCRIKKKKKKA